MSDYVLFTDATADIPAELVRHHDIQILPMEITIGSESLMYGADWTQEESHNFYERLRKGERASTTQITPMRYEEAFEPLLEAGRSILCVCFSSGLSDTYQSACMAEQALRERYPQAQLHIVDSLAATYGEGQVVLAAARKREEGLSAAETAAWLRENIGRFAHWFTVDDLMFLKRGGRISAATAVMGTTFKLKPVMHMDAQGRLVPADRVQGRKNSLKAIARKMAESCPCPDKTLIYIGHGDAKADANFLAERIRELLAQTGEVFIGPICPIVGAHSGPGTIALFFDAKYR